MTKTTIFRYVLGMLSLAALVWSMRLAGAQATPEQAQLILHLLYYVAVDYPQCVQDGTVLDQSEYDEQVEFSQQVHTLLRQLSAHVTQSGLLSQAEQLVMLIQGRRPGPEVSALARRPQGQPSRQRLLDGAKEAHLIALRCSQPPAGQAKWTLKLLADKLVALDVVATSSYETVRQTLKKTYSNRTCTSAG